MNGTNKIAAAIVVAGLSIAVAHAINNRYDYTQFSVSGTPHYVVMHDKWTGRSCVTAGNQFALAFANLPFC